MATYEKITDTKTTIDENGNSYTTIIEKETARSKFVEPDYIKLYTKMWCEFNGIPAPYRNLFLQLALRMTYCNSAKLKESQLVSTGVPYADELMEVCGWQSKRMLQKGLKALCDCNAIKRINKGVYQINPSYAGKGKWMYDSRSEQGGVKDLVSEFNFVEGTVDTRIVFADDGSPTEYNQKWRNGLDVKAKDKTIFKTIDKKKQSVVK